MLLPSTCYSLPARATAIEDDDLQCVDETGVMTMFDEMRRDHAAILSKEYNQDELYKEKTNNVPLKTHQCHPYIPYHCIDFTLRALSV